MEKENKQENEGKKEKKIPAAAAAAAGILLILLLAGAAALTVLVPGSGQGKDRTVKKGDLVTLGKFEQDGDLQNGPEAVEWYVIDSEEGEEGRELLLLSRYCLSCMAYHSPVGDITWDQSSMRAYLNGPFLEETFGEEERKQILPVLHENPGNELLGIDGGPDTQDSVFLLSAEEADVYLGREEDRWLYARAEATQKAEQEGIYIAGQDPSDGSLGQEEETGYTRWWLRGPGNEAYSAQIVEEDGQTFAGGAAVDIDYMYGLRPALFVRISEDAEIASVR